MQVSRRSLIVAVPIALAVVAAAILITVSRHGSSTPTPPAAAADLSGVGQAQDLVSGIPSNGDTLGNPNAKVTIVEYGDLRCPVCKAFSAQELPTVVSELVRSGKAKLQLRLWPITQPQADAVTANEAGYAAAQQNALWLFAELWWLNQGDETTTYASDAYIHAIASGAGLDLTKLDAYRNSSAAADAVNATNSAANQLRLTGTPSIVVVGPGGQRAFTSTVPSADQIAKAVQAVST
jgi:protein-disulfide isomerase